MLTKSTWSFPEPVSDSYIAYTKVNISYMTTEFSLKNGGQYKNKELYFTCLHFFSLIVILF